MKECLVCQSCYVEKHHVFYGTKNRKISEKMGFVEWLCPEDHRGNRGVHFNKQLDLELKQKHQRIYEETHSREEFIKLIGRNYL